MSRTYPGERNPFWHGTNIGYMAAHTRARRRLPLICEMADETCSKRIEIALRHDAPRALIRSSPQGNYYVGSNSADGYRTLCTAHHRLADGFGPSVATHCKHGHPFDEANTYFWRRPSSGRLERSCRACARERARTRLGISA